MKSIWQINVTIDHGREEDSERIEHALRTCLDGRALDDFRTQTGPRIDAVLSAGRLGDAP